MCEYSVHAANRKAGKAEDLELRHIPRSCGHKGFYPADRSDNLLVCMKRDRNVTIDRVMFDRDMIPEQWFKAFSYLEGQTNVKARFVYGRTRCCWGRSRPITVDALVINGETINLRFFSIGTRMTFGVGQSKGMQVIERAIVEAMALPPEPKPDDEPKEPSEPAPSEPAPAEPPTEPTPTARRYHVVRSYRRNGKLVRQHVRA